MQGLSKTRTELPEMLVLDILSKLPAKSLTRFKCVCKDWSSSFQTPLFITQHHHNHLRNNNLNILFKRPNGTASPDCLYFSLFQLSNENGQGFSLKQSIVLLFFDDHWRSPQGFGPCNGILCVESEGNLALWNPSTRQFKILPQSSVQRPHSVDYIRFDSIGFGYDSQTDDYKEISYPGVSALDRPWYDNNHVNEIYYWLAYGSNAHGISCILSFDMVKERFSTLSLPEFNGAFVDYELQLVNFNGVLGAFIYPYVGILKCFEIWVMSGSWTKLFSIESISLADRPLGF
ncbi:hypothetical protein GQ457_14G007420 [Hibiscus cannabinus]